MRSVRRSRVALVLVGCSAAVLVVTLIVRAASGMLTWDRGLALAFILPLVCFNYIALSTRQQQAAAALLRAGLCPACGYPLGGNLPEADGCCACPECGSAWRRFDQVK